MKRTPLQRKSPLNRSPIKAKPAKRRPKRDTVEFGETTKKKVRIRADFRCEIDGCNHHIQEFHHRKMRSQQGKGTTLNCLALCSPHHRRVHENPDWAYRHGQLVRGHNDPRDIPVFAGCPLNCPMDHASQ